MITASSSAALLERRVVEAGVDPARAHAVRPDSRSTAVVTSSSGRTLTAKVLAHFWDVDQRGGGGEPVSV
jgi:hypothetical protein